MSYFWAWNMMLIFLYFYFGCFVKGLFELSSLLVQSFIKEGKIILKEKKSDLINHLFTEEFKFCIFNFSVRRLWNGWRMITYFLLCLAFLRSKWIQHCKNIILHELMRSLSHTFKRNGLNFLSTDSDSNFPFLIYLIWYQKFW